MKDLPQRQTVGGIASDCSSTKTSSESMGSCRTAASSRTSKKLKEEEKKEIQGRKREGRPVTARVRNFCQMKINILTILDGPLAVCAQCQWVQLMKNIMNH